MNPGPDHDPATRRTVALVTLGCARNEVDSEELAGRLDAGGWVLVDDPALADAVVVNTCGFVDVAKKDSIDTILAASDLRGPDAGPQAVVAVGCLAERYGRDLAESLPEADAVLGFDSYPEISDTLLRIVQGERPAAHEPSDRRQLLPISPVDRVAHTASVPGHGDRGTPGWQPPMLRKRLDDSPVAPVKLASGCDRRCSFCAIPSFRGSFISRPMEEIVAEMAWLRESGVREVVLVSENSTSYGKDLGNLRLLEESLEPLAVSTGIERIRVAYLQPAEVRPGLLAAIARTPGIASYFDLSFQHASSSVLRRMRRFGGVDEFLGLVEQIRTLAPDAGIRSNVIVGFPGETDEEFADLLRFLTEARLDAVGVFGYSDEEGTEAATLPGGLEESVIKQRVEIATSLVDELMAQRAEERIGSIVRVLVERIDVERIDEDESGTFAVGRAEHQGPDDAATLIPGSDARPGDFVDCRVIDTEGVDLIAEPIE